MIPLQARSIFRRAAHGLRTSATYDDLAFEQVELDHFVYVHTVAVHDETTDACAVVFIITTIGEDYPAVRFAQADKDTGNSKRADFWMRGGDILVARFYDGAASDVLNAYVHGVEYCGEYEPLVPLE